MPRDTTRIWTTTVVSAINTIFCPFGGLCEDAAVPKRKIIVNIATSADGYVARTDGNLDLADESASPKRASTV